MAMGARLCTQNPGLMIFGNECTALNPGWRFVELTLPWAKNYNPYRVEIVPTPCPSRGGRGFVELILRTPGGSVPRWAWACCRGIAIRCDIERTRG